MLTHKYVNFMHQIANDAGKFIDGYQTIANNGVDDDREYKFGTYDLDLTHATTDAERKFVESLSSSPPAAETEPTVSEKPVAPPSKPVPSKDKKIDKPNINNNVTKSLPPAQSSGNVGGAQNIIADADSQVAAMRALIATPGVPHDTWDIAIKNCFHKIGDNGKIEKTKTLNFLALATYLEKEHGLTQQESQRVYNAMLIAANPEGNPGAPGLAITDNTVQLAMNAAKLETKKVVADKYNFPQPNASGANNAGMVGINSEKAKTYPYLYALENNLHFDGTNFYPKAQGPINNGYNSYSANSQPVYSSGNPWYDSFSRQYNPQPQYSAAPMPQQNNGQFLGQLFSTVALGLLQNKLGGNQFATNYQTPNYYQSANYLPRYSTPPLFPSGFGYGGLG